VEIDSDGSPVIHMTLKNGVMPVIRDGASIDEMCDAFEKAGVVIDKEEFDEAMEYLKKKVDVELEFPSRVEKAVGLYKQGVYTIGEAVDAVLGGVKLSQSKMHELFNKLSDSSFSSKK